MHTVLYKYVMYNLGKHIRSYR